MDGRMPGMDGVEATRMIKVKWPHMKVILLSMYPEYREAAYQAGADSFISKGETPEKLLEAICAVLNC
jgi:DNA-binding NarL/FixJ family response regulator